MTRRTTAILLSLVVAAAACSDGDTAATTTTTTLATTTTTAASTTTTTVDESTVPATPPRDHAGFRAQPTACGAEQPAEPSGESFTAPEDSGITGAAAPVTIVDTSCGRILIALDPVGAPETVNSFAFLADQGYFDGSVIHRIVPSFVIQGGDPTGTGRGNPGYSVADEPPNAGFEYTRGTVAMANAGPGTTGSQFFVMLADVALPPSYTVIGAVTEGMDVVDRIAEVPVVAGPSGEISSPTETVYVERVTVER
jgi:peptidyl-prolyl cis-trans isomerase B (cyclophilin B)